MGELPVEVGQPAAKVEVLRVQELQGLSQQRLQQHHVRPGFVLHQLRPDLILPAIFRSRLSRGKQNK